MGLEQVILALSLALLVAQVLAWRWSINIERRLEGRDGYVLARLLTQIIGWSTVARAIGVGATLPLVADRANMDAALTFALIAQAMGAAIFGWAAWRIWRIDSRQEETHGDAASAEGAEGGEGVGVQVDQVGVRPAVAVDDTHGDATLSGTH